MRNDLEAVIAARHPEIGEMRELLTENGAAGVLMSGSGPSVFGLWDGALPEDELTLAAMEHGWRFYAARLRTVATA
ncbi:MAG: hypothetical protein M5R36_24095 [Deltaproteobacteria bacterium]|nr:hypothetical protein [Deltaproteobacteria bacterium]